VSPVGTWAVKVTDGSSTASLAVEEVARLLAACDRIGPRTSALVAMQLYDGLRLGEVLAADANDVTFRGHAAELALRRRTGSDEVPLDRRSTMPLRAYLDGRTTGPLLLGESPTRVRGRLTRFGADYLLKQAGIAAGLGRRVSSNVLRRSFVGRLHAEGIPIEEIRDRLGHRDVRTTRRHIDGISG
jgi:integrase